MLRIDLAAARAGAVDTPGQVDPADPIWEGSELVLVAPLVVRGRFSAAGEGRYFWHARMDARVRMDCRRCLTPVEVPLSQELELLFGAEDEGLEEDAGCYAIPARARELDLRETLREELLLAVPQFVECRPDCRGLCPECGANLNAGPCGCRPTRDPRWQALSDLLPGSPTKD